MSTLQLLGHALNGMAHFNADLAGRAAFRLFCWPRRRRVKREEAAFMATADTYYETIGGRRVAVHAWGFRGPIVLLAHGWESHAGRWRKLAPRLVEAGYQVVAVDAPAHGRSPGWQCNVVMYAEVLRGLLQRLGPVEAVVGHSVGGAATIWALGTLSPAARPPRAVILAAFSELQTVFEGGWRVVPVNRRVKAGFERFLIQLTGHPMTHFSPARMTTRLPDVEALLVHDRGDRVTPFRESERIAAHWPGARLWATEGFGHGLTAPAVTDRIVGFLAADPAEDAPDGFEPLRADSALSG